MAHNSPKGVRISHLTKVYPAYRGGEPFRAVNDISVDISPGEFVTLLGPSGCGKTTTLRMVAGFEEITGGEIYIGDRLINLIAPDKRDTAMVFQSYALFPNYNVYDNIGYGLKIRKLPADEIDRRVREAIGLVGLSGLEGRQINQISGGQQQRVALARALVVEPSVLLFDEPLSNLDARLRVQMRTEIRKIQKKLGITTLYVTHDQSEAMSLSDRIIILKDGVITQVGTPEEIYYHPASEFVANFVGTANLFRGTLLACAGGKADVEIGGVPLRGIDCRRQGSPGEPVCVIARPEAVALSREEGIPCTVSLSTLMGEYLYYEAEFGQQTVQIHQSNPKAQMRFAPGEQARLLLMPESLYAL